MYSCDLLDLRCIYVNELVGDPTLAVIIALILYFIVSIQMRLKFITTIVLLVPIILIISQMFSGFSAIYAFLTVIVGIMVSWAFNRVIKNF